MQMRKSLLIGMVIASLWAATGFVQPVWGQDGGRAGRGGMLLRLIHKEADLTDDQKLQLKSILASHREALRTLRTQLQAKRELLTDMLLGASPVTSDDPQLKSLAQQASDLQGQIAQEWLGTMVEVRNMLTPDQLTKVEGLKNQLRTLHSQIHSLWMNPQ